MLAWFFGMVWNYMAMALRVCNSNTWTGFELDLVLNDDIYYLSNPPALSVQPMSVLGFYFSCQYQATKKNTDTATEQINDICNENHDPQP